MTCRYFDQRAIVLLHQILSLSYAHLQVLMSSVGEGNTICVHSSLRTNWIRLKSIVSVVVLVYLPSELLNFVLPHHWGPQLWPGALGVEAIREPPGPPCATSPVVAVPSRQQAPLRVARGRRPPRPSEHVKKEPGGHERPRWRLCRPPPIYLSVRPPMHSTVCTHIPPETCCARPPSTVPGNLPLQSAGLVPSTAPPSQMSPPAYPPQPCSARPSMNFQEESVAALQASTFGYSASCKYTGHLSAWGGPAWRCGAEGTCACYLRERGCCPLSLPLFVPPPDGALAGHIPWTQRPEQPLLLLRPRHAPPTRPEQPLCPTPSHYPGCAARGPPCGPSSPRHPMYAEGPSHSGPRDARHGEGHPGHVPHHRALPRTSGCTAPVGREGVAFWYPFVPPCGLNNSPISLTSCEWACHHISRSGISL